MTERTLRGRRLRPLVAILLILSPTNALLGSAPSARPPFRIVSPRYNELSPDFERRFFAMVRDCSVYFARFDALLGRIVEAGSSLPVTESPPGAEANFATSVGNPASGYRALLTVHIENLERLVDHWEIERQNATEPPGKAFPFTPRCAVLGHEIAEAFAYDEALPNGTRDPGESRRESDLAHLRGVAVENEIAAELGHRFDAEHRPVERLGSCAKDGEARLVIGKTLDGANLVEIMEFDVHNRLVEQRGVLGAGLSLCRGNPSWRDERP